VAVLGRLLVSSAERLDLPDLLSIDSYGAGDWKYFLKGLVGDSRPYILKGFDLIDPASAIGTQSCSIRVADSVVFYPGSNAGAFFHGLPDGNTQAAPLVPELRKNAVNYVYLTFSTFNTSTDTRAFWDPDKDGGAGGEFTQDVNTESVLKVDINVSTGSFPANTIPVAKVTVGPVVITAVEDARDMMFRLGSGGISPNPFSQYTWRTLPGSTYQRSEPAIQMQAGGINPFQGADKNIFTLKEWMDAVMSRLKELGGTAYWYDDTSTYGVVTGFFDSCATAFKSKGQWTHDTATPGLLTWSEDINIKMASDPRTYIVRQGTKTLADEQVAYVPMVRNHIINTNDEKVSWTNGQPYINTIGGAIGLFANLAKGDWVKKVNDSFDKWLRVEEFYDAVNLGGSSTTAAGARSVRLSGNYAGSTFSEKARYDKGSYEVSDVVVSDRNSATIANVGGNFHWLAMRSDTIQNISNVISTSLSIAISEHDGATAKVLASGAHGLIDGDRITITGTTNFNGTYIVEVESTTVFYINKTGATYSSESGSAFYATITTSTRSSTYGFQEESANHGFKTNDVVKITGTTNFNGAYNVSKRSATTFTIPIGSALSTETSGSATLPRAVVRTEGSVAQIIQGEVVDIGGSTADNIRQYLGMNSLSELTPTYSIPTSYNTINGMQNYNSGTSDNITARVSKLTAMMADKAQDKVIKYLPSGINTITNTTSGSAQQITFGPSGSSLTLITPGSTGTAVISLPDSSPGISLTVNQVAYVSIDRNNVSFPSISVSDISTLSVDENIFVIAARLSSTEIYIWEGSVIAPGAVPGPGYINTVLRQNQMLKLVEGGTWAWNLGTEVVSWSASAYIQVPGLVNSVNSIASGSATLASGQVAYVDISRVTPGGALTVNVASNASLSMTTDRFIIARREGSDVVVGLHSMRLIDGESKKLYAGSSDQTLTYTGQPNEADSTPTYVNVTNGLSPYIVSQGDNLTLAIGETIGNTNAIFTTLDQPSYDEDVSVVSSGSLSTLSLSNGAGITGGHGGAITSFTYPYNIAIPFKFSSNQTLTEIHVWFAGTASTPTVQMALHNNNITEPGTLLTTSPDIFYTSTLTSTPTETVFTFTPTPIVGSTVYWAVMTLLGPGVVVLNVQGSTTDLGGAGVAKSYWGGPWQSYPTDPLFGSAYLHAAIYTSSGLGTNELLSPVTSGTTLTLPVNSRLTGSPQQYYVVGKGALELYLNGQFLLEGTDWSPVGASLSVSDQIVINQGLVAGDKLSYRLDATGGPGSGGSGAADDNMHTLPAEVTADNNDEVLIYHVASSAYRKQTRANFLSGLNGTVNVATYTSNQTLTSNDGVALVNATTGNITITLPNPSTVVGRIYYIKKVDSSSNSVILNPGAYLLDGASSFSFNIQYQSFTIVASSTGYFIL
jgi:hypothetical protein